MSVPSSDSLHKCVACKRIHKYSELKFLNDYPGPFQFRLIEQCPWCGNTELVPAEKEIE